MADLIHVPTLVIQAINLGIIVFVLWKFFFKPYLAFLDVEAQKRIQLEEDISSSAHIVDTARTEAEKIRDDARIDAKTMANEIVENARKEAETIRTGAATEAELARKKGFADVEHERKVLADTMKQKVLDVALKMNQKLFGKNEANEQFLKNSHKDINF